MVLQDFSTAVEEDFFSHHYKLAFHKESYRLYLETVDLVGKVFLTLSYSELWRLHWQSTCSSYSLSLSPKREISPPDLLIKLDFFTVYQQPTELQSG